MSTKVISTKIPTEEYDRIVEECNHQGCTISDYLRQKCMIEEEEKVEFTQDDRLDDLKGKIESLESALSSVKSDLFGQKRRIDELYELFSSEIVHKKICRDLHSNS